MLNTNQQKVMWKTLSHMQKWFDEHGVDYLEPFCKRNYVLNFLTLESDNILNMLVSIRHSDAIRFGEDWRSCQSAGFVWSSLSFVLRLTLKHKRLVKSRWLHYNSINANQDLFWRKKPALKSKWNRYKNENNSEKHLLGSGLDPVRRIVETRVQHWTTLTAVELVVLYNIKKYLFDGCERCGLGAKQL